MSLSSANNTYSDLSGKISQLNGSATYLRWRSDIEACLTAMGLADALNESYRLGATANEKVRKECLKAAGILKLSMDAYERDDFEELKFADEVWNFVKGKYGAESARLTISARRALMNLQMCDDMSLEHYIKEHKKVGGNVSGEDLVGALLNGINDELSFKVDCYFNNVDDSTKFDHRSVLDMLQQRIQEEFARQATRMKTEASSWNEELAWQVRGSQRAPGRGKKNGGGGQDNSRELNGNNQGNQMRRTQLDKRKCYSCGSIEHLMRACPDKQGRRRSRNDDGQEVALMAVQNQSNKKYYWIIASGASSHMTSNLDVFTKLDRNMKSNIFIADDRQLEVEGVGEAEIVVEDGEGTFSKLKLLNVYYIPNLQHNLLSISKSLNQPNINVEFQKDCCIIKKSGKPIAMADRINSLYILKTFQKVEANSEGFVATEETKIMKEIDEWHLKLGHINEDYLSYMSKHKMVVGIPEFARDEKMRHCDICAEKKSKTTVNRTPMRRRTTIVELVHAGLVGPMEALTPPKKKYMLTMVDYYSRKTFIRLLEKKSDAVKKLLEIFNMIETKAKTKIQNVKSDDGGEFFAIRHLRIIVMKMELNM